MIAGGPGAQIRRHLLQQAQIRGRVAILGACHQDRPVEFVARRTLRVVLLRVRLRPDQLQAIAAFFHYRVPCIARKDRTRPIPWSSDSCPGPSAMTQNASAAQ